MTNMFYPGVVHNPAIEDGSMTLAIRAVQDPKFTRRYKVYGDVRRRGNWFCDEDGNKIKRAYRKNCVLPISTPKEVLSDSLRARLEADFGDLSAYGTKFEWSRFISAHSEYFTNVMIDSTRAIRVHQITDDEKSRSGLLRMDYGGRTWWGYYGYEATNSTEMYFHQDIGVAFKNWMINIYGKRFWNDNGFVYVYSFHVASLDEIAAWKEEARLRKEAYLAQVASWKKNVLLRNLAYEKRKQEEADEKILKGIADQSQLYSALIAEADDEFMSYYGVGNLEMK